MSTEFDDLIDGGMVEASAMMGTSRTGIKLKKQVLGDFDPAIGRPTMVTTSYDIDGVVTDDVLVENKTAVVGAWLSFAGSELPDGVAVNQNDNIETDGGLAWKILRIDTSGLPGLWSLFIHK